jgi:hypothetical protein
VPVAGWIVGGRARDALSGERLGDGIQALAGQVRGEDPAGDGSGLWVGFEAVQALAVGGLARVGMRAGVDKPVPIGWASAEEAALDGDLWDEPVTNSV